jgi:hypothetical protein
MQQSHSTEMVAIARCNLIANSPILLFPLKPTADLAVVAFDRSPGNTEGQVDIGAKPIEGKQKLSAMSRRNGPGRS